ncbi:MAG: N-acetylmuramoyl-L-alanine amidase family protein [Enterocloster sp.]
MRIGRLVCVAAFGICMAAALPVAALGAQTAGQGGTNGQELQTGWITEGSRLKFVDNDGYFVKNEWRSRDGKSYYLDSNGNAALDTWIDNTYYVNEAGVMVKNDWVYEDGKSGLKKAGWYYMGRDGKAEKNDWKVIERFRYCFDSEGRMRTGWYYEDGNIYYLGEKDEGFAHTGWQYLESDGENRPAEGSISRKLSEGQSGGRWFYFQNNGKAKCAEEKGYASSTIDGKKYYFDENGIMLTGWIGVKESVKPGDAVGVSRFLYLGDKGEGVLRGRWLEVSEHPWDSPDGELFGIESRDYKGPKKGETARYYLSSDGTPVFLQKDASTVSTAAVRIDGEYYFFDGYGCMQTGLIRIRTNNQIKTAYFDEEGRMITGKTAPMEDKNGKEHIFCFSTSGSDKGSGITGEKDGFLYYEGVLAAAEEGSRYAPYRVGGKVYLVNESGKIQTDEHTYETEDGKAYVIEDGILYYADEDGEKVDEVKTGKSLPSASYDHVYNL